MSAPDTSCLDAFLREILAPLLEGDGFSGGGRRFHRLSGPWIQVLTVQGSRSGESFAVNLGIQYATAPDVTGGRPEPGAMTEAECDFRRRLSESIEDRWWEHGGDEASVRAAVESAAQVYTRHGRRCFELACDALSAMSPADLASGTYDLQGFGTTQVRLALVLARIRKLEGNVDDARAFATYGLRHAGAAVSLRKELRGLASA